MAGSPEEMNCCPFPYFQMMGTLDNEFKGFVTIPNRWGSDET